MIKTNKKTGKRSERAIATKKKQSSEVVEQMREWTQTSENKTKMKNKKIENKTKIKQKNKTKKGVKH